MAQSCGRLAGRDAHDRVSGVVGLRARLSNGPRSEIQDPIAREQAGQPVDPTIELHPASR
jgi:hypothetical protein